MDGNGQRGKESSYQDCIEREERGGEGRREKERGGEGSRGSGRIGRVHQSTLQFRHDSPVVSEHQRYVYPTSISHT
jgi:hypothetical protein